VNPAPQAGGRGAGRSISSARALRALVLLAGSALLALVLLAAALPALILLAAALPALILLAAALTALVLLAALLTGLALLALVGLLAHHHLLHALRRAGFKNNTMAREPSPSNGLPRAERTASASASG